MTVGEDEPTVLTKAQWIAAADAICSDFNDLNGPLSERFEQLQAEDGDQGVYDEMAGVLREAAEALGAEADGLRALEPPLADVATIDKMLSGLEGIVVAEDSLADALEDADFAQIDGFSDVVTEKGLTIRGMAQGYGLKVCGADD